MKTTKPSHRTIAVFLTLNFLTTLLPINLIYASNNGPTAPEAASFEPVDATDMVNLATGDLSYVLPLLNVPSPEGGYPLALSYHAGIALDQEASWVGLGWNLNPGAINRSVSGVPDDWERGLKSKISFDKGGTITYDNIFAGVGVSDDMSIGLNASWATNKAFNGENNTSFNWGATLRYQDQKTGTSGSLGISSSGFSYGLGYKGMGLNSEILNAGESSIGISLGSGNNLKISRSNSNSNSGRSSTATSMVPSSASLNVNLNFLLFQINYNRSKFKYWSFDERTFDATGSLYAGSLDNILNSEPLYAYQEFDSSESLYSEISFDKMLSENNPSFANYDNYQIDAQGVNGSISPRLHQVGRLYDGYTNLTDNSLFREIQSGFTSELKYINANEFDNNIGSIVSNDYTKKLDASEIQKPHFYFQNSYSSYLKTQNVDFMEDYLDVSGKVDLTSLLDNSSYNFSEQSSGLHSPNGRLRKGEYISTYTNGEIISNGSLVFEIPNFERSTMPSDGIGAFKVTTMDGKTYHYSIPVYQKEQFTKYTKSEQNFNNTFVEDQSLHPYATHWLLTGITGPDFIDNGNNTIDEGDLGYWIRFDYGKWSDGYSWRMPKTGFNYSDSAKSFSWGVKDIYYLNSISTRTHTALFVKEERFDGYSSSQQMLDSNGNAIYKEAFYKSYDLNLPWKIGSDGLIYFPGAYGELGLPIGVTGTDTDLRASNWFYAKTFSTTSLALKEIILLENANLPESFTNLSSNLGNSNSQNPNAAEFLFEEELRASRDYNEHVPRYTYHSTTYRGQYNSNILNKGDFDFTDLRGKALKVIEFNYDYSLGKHQTTDSGKLSLKSLSVKGKAGKSLIPPYKFNYFDENPAYSIDRSGFDAWGYYERPYVWSLQEIQHPLGGKIKINYESDEYFEKSVASSYIDSNLQLKFEGTHPGSKSVSVRQKPDLHENQIIDFREYFNVGQDYILDILYHRNTNTNSPNWIADIAASCEAIEVGQNYVKFQLPPSSNQSLTRNLTNCDKKDWVYYETGEYHHVVDETNDWDEESQEWLCDWPTDGSQKVKIRVFFDESENQKIGGGLRAKSVAIVDELGNQYQTRYFYTKKDATTGDLTTETSGTTSFAPIRKHRKDIPYNSFLPAPGVLYENVRVVHEDNTFVDYKFNVLDDFILDPEGSIVYESKFLSIHSSGNIVRGENLNTPGRHVLIDQKDFEIKEKLAELGRLIEVKQYNSNGHLLKATNYEYQQESEINGRYDTESFIKQESFVSDNFTRTGVNLTATSYSQIPSIIKRITEVENGYSKSIEYQDFDAITGKETIVISKDSKGTQIKTKKVPAYSKYSEMGSKVDDLSNKNMLSQEAMNISEKYDSGQWKKTGASITTWEDWGNNIWRKQKSFTWDGTTDTNGYFTNYSNDVNDDDNFDWVNNVPGASNSEWKLLSEITKYNDYSMPLEVRDINQNYVATKVGYSDSKNIATGNSGYDEMFYSGAEDDNGQGTYGGNVLKGTASNSTDAHTGTNALTIGSGQNGFRVNVNFGGVANKKFKVSLWAKFGNHANTRISIDGGASIVDKENERVRAGQWIQLNFYLEVPSGSDLYVTSQSGSTTVDDFRMHPVPSSMTSYVYNEWGELSHILGANNMAIYYSYDAMGRLKSSESEVADFNGPGTGGFKKASEINYTYKH